MCKAEKQVSLCINGPRPLLWVRLSVEERAELWAALLSGLGSPDLCPRIWRRLFLHVPSFFRVLTGSQTERGGRDRAGCPCTRLSVGTTKPYRARAGSFGISGDLSQPRPPPPSLGALRWRPPGPLPNLHPPVSEGSISSHLL